MRSSFSLLLLFFLLMACSSPEQEQEKQAINAEIEAVENGLGDPVLFEAEPLWTIEERMAHYGVPGMSIAVIKDHKVHWHKTYGIMDRDSKEPVNEFTLFQAGSISKPVAAMAMLKQVEKGVLRLDQNVNDYLTSWQMPDNEFTEKEKVTLGRIVSHTGGITVHGFPGYRTTDKVPSIVQVLDAEGPANTGVIRVDTQPGTIFRYSGGGYCVMQLLLEDVLGQSFPEITKSSVLQPLGMSHSSYEQPLPTDWQTKAATGYLPDGSKVEGKWHIYPEMAAAGLWTTATDLAQVFIELQNGIKGTETKVLSPEMAAQMLTPYFEDFVGLGIFLENNDGDWYFSHGGWDEGFSSEAVAHKTDGYGVVVLTNSNHPPFISEVIRSVAATYDWKNRQAPVYKRQALSEEEVAAIAGHYLYDKDQTVNIYEEDGRLFLKYLKGKLPEELVKIGENKYIRSSRTNIIRFLPHPESGELNLVFLEKEADAPTFKFPRMAAEKKVPFQYIVEKNFPAALAAYQELKKNYPAEPFAQEAELNTLGYNLMFDDRIELAIDVFRINVALYPTSSNVYDSLGEAYLKNGNKRLAGQNYQKSLQLDGTNKNALKVLKELGMMAKS